MGKIAAVVIMVILGVYLVLVQPVMNNMQGSQMDAVIKTDKNILKRFLLEDDVLPSKSLFEKLDKEQTTLETDYKQLVGFLDSEFNNLPRGSESGLFFKESVFALEKKLDRQSKGAGVSIPDSLGFGTDLPSEQELPRLVRQIELVDMLVTSLISEGATVIEDIKLLDFSKEDAGDFEKIPVEVVANISNEGLIRTLYTVYTASPAISVESLTVKRIDGVLEVDMVIAGFIFKNSNTER